MAKIVQSTCTDSGSKVETKYGMRVVADFEAPEDDDIAVWEDADSDDGRALMNLQPGSDVTLVREQDGNSTYYKLEESEKESLLSGSNGQDARTNPRSNQNGSSSTSKKEVAREILTDATRLAHLEVEVYSEIRESFRERDGEIPPPESLSSLTSTVIIQIAQDRL